MCFNAWNSIFSTYFTENMCKLFDMYTQLKQWHINRCYAHCTLLFKWKYEEGDLVNSFAHVSSADIKWDCLWNENELHAWLKWENREHFLMNRYFWSTKARAQSKVFNIKTLSPLIKSSTFKNSVSIEQLLVIQL